MSNVITIMIGVSLLTFFIILATFLWAIKNKQFDDEYKFITLNDDEEALNDIINLQKRKEEALRKQKKLS
ncbi:cbb3-type cytochrome oxidase assembly protein CcoS [Campylobacter sp. TTU_617]|uniref:cbb3-type cytochrome oxidase assembly protein CcoS n=1 Tax=Campylobacter sp. TTU_617 TaxID=2768148 RepID=UPI001905067A|nr:cbb3-type cytochrome oxidase assembly protein CcoS [Campylobacter sp. TTU_617]MBK1971680.1 cbb3-type cytochrome oxidase assembly protein CcoS [Campylobacter sp. TTU_617]